MVSVYAKDLTGIALFELIDLCFKCRPDPLDGKEFSQRKQETIARVKAELAKRDPSEVVDHLIDKLVRS